MSTRYRFGLSCAAMVVLAAILIGAAGPGVPRLVRTVDSVSLVTTDDDPPQLKIVAEGTVPTGGWTRPALVLRRGSPNAGVYEFDFQANAPTGPATQVITTLGATYTFKAPPKDLRSVRIHAQTNHKDAKAGR